MDTIWKLPVHIPNSGLPIYDLPVTVGAELLRVDHQPPQGLQAWVRLDPVAAPATIRVTVIGTGYPIPEFMTRFVNTIMTGEFVFHVFTEEN